MFKYRNEHVFNIYFRKNIRRQLNRHLKVIICNFPSIFGWGYGFEKRTNIFNISVRIETVSKIASKYCVYQTTIYGRSRSVLFRNLYIFRFCFFFSFDSTICFVWRLPQTFSFFLFPQRKMPYPFFYIRRYIPRSNATCGFSLFMFMISLFFLSLYPIFHSIGLNWRT